MAEEQQFGISIVRRAVEEPLRQIITNVVRTAIQHAASVAGMMLTTEAVTAERPKKESAAPAGGAPDMGGMGMSLPVSQ